MENEILSVVLLPALGGKVASIYRRDKDFEMVAQCEKDAYQIPEFGADFSAYDASGLDDMFPNISAAEVELHGKGISIRIMEKYGADPFRQKYRQTA